MMPIRLRLRMSISKTIRIFILEYVLTTQIKEKIIYKDQSCILMNMPLDNYLAENTIDIVQVFDVPVSVPTCLWRGYIGYWLITDQQLFLCKVTSFDGNLCDFYQLFGENSESPYFCKWFTGILKIVEDHQSEEMLCIEIENGKIVSEKQIQIKREDQAIERLITHIQSVESNKTNKFRMVIFCFCFIIMIIFIWAVKQESIFH